MANRSGHRARSAQRKLGVFFVVMATLAALLGITSSTASATAIGPGSGTGFEIEGNQVDAGNDSAIDWQSVIGSSDLTVINDPEPDSGIGVGAKEQVPSGWGCHTGNPPKDDILQVAINQRISPQSAYLDLATVRAAGTGDTHVNFEFNQQPVSFDCNAGYVGRTDGDLLLLLEFPGNGTAAVDVYRWDTTPPGPDDGNDGEWILEPGLPVGLATGAENDGIIAGSENYLFGGTDIPDRAFAEVSVNLGLILGEDENTGTCTHFGSVGVRSRTSGESITSELKDIVGPSPIDLSTCGGVTIHKTDDAGNPLAGAQFGLFTTQALADTRLAANAEKTCTSIADGSCSFDEVNPGHYFINEISAPAGYSIDPSTKEVDVAFRQQVDVEAPFVDPRDTGFVQVTKALVDQNGAPVVPANLATLNGAAFQLYSDANNNLAMDPGEAVTLWNSATLAGCTITNSLGTCSFGPVAVGSYRLTETAVPAQTNKGPDVPVTVTKGTVANPVLVTYTNSLNPLQIDLQKSGPLTANIGDVFTYTFTVTTTGPPLHAIDLVELAPDRCNNGPITLVSKGGGDQDNFLEVGESWLYSCSHLTTPADGTTLHNVAQVTGTDDFGRTVSDTDDHDVTILYPNLQVVKTAVPATVDAGGNAGFSITTTNLGPGTALNVTLTDTLPPGTWTIGGADGAACSGTSGTMTCSFGSMSSPGTPKVVTLTRATTIADCGTINNSVSVATTYSGSNIDTDTSNNTSNAGVAVSCPDVEVHKVAEATPISAGDTARYTVTVHNLGSGQANGVTLDDPLPAGGGGLTWVIDSQSSGMGCTIGTKLSCGPFDLTANTTVGDTKTVVISAVTAPADCGQLDNTATITVPGGDTNPANDTSEKASIVVLCPDLGITKVADAPSVSAGDPIGFTITVSNTGDGVAKAVTLTDPLPTGVVWKIEDPVPTGCTISAGTLSCTARDLAKGDTLVVHITAPTTQDDCKAYENTATADGSNTEPVPATDSTLVLCPGLNLLKTSDAPVVDAGGQIGFTVTVANAAGEGVGTAKGVTVHDPLPAGDGISWSVASQTGVPASCAITAGVLDCGPVDLAPGESFAVHVVSATPGGLTNASLPAACKAYDNTAVADATNASELTASATTSVRCPIAIQIVKDGPATATRGATVTYTFAVTNTGKADLVTVELTDARCDAGTIKQVSNGNGDAVLAVGETWNYTCTHVITATDPNPLPNTATVVGSDKDGRTTTDSDDHVINLTEVLGEVIVPPAAVALPRTGMDPKPLLGLGALLFALGVALLVTSDERLRRRRRS